MSKFLVYHTLPTDLSFEQLEQMAPGTQTNPDTRACRSFFSLAKGKGICIWEASDSESVASRLRELQIPFDDVMALDVEGEGAALQKV